MRKSILFPLIFLTLLSCKNESNQKSISTVDTKQIINSVLNDWHLAATEANFDAYFSKMDSVSVFIGTDASENWSKSEFQEFSKPYFVKGKAWSFETLERNVYVNSDESFAWFDELLRTWMGTCRGSGVLEKKGENWLIKHYVLSVSIPNDDIQKVIEAKKEKDSIFLSRFK